MPKRGSKIFVEEGREPQGYNLLNVFGNIKKGISFFPKELSNPSIYGIKKTDFEFSISPQWTSLFLGSFFLRFNSN